MVIVTHSADLQNCVVKIMFMEQHLKEVSFVEVVICFTFDPKSDIVFLMTKIRYFKHDVKMVSSNYLLFIIICL